MHAAVWDGSGRGQGEEKEYAETLRFLVEAGTDKNDRRHFKNKPPLAVALESGNAGAIGYLRAIGAKEEI